MDNCDHQDLISALEQLINTIEETKHESLIQVRQSFAEFKIQLNEFDHLRGDQRT